VALPWLGPVFQLLLPQNYNALYARISLFG
jgi:hypothetical protein